MSQDESVVGWGHAANEEFKFAQTVSTVFAMGLRELGIEEVFTIVGGGVAPLADALQTCKLKIRHFRHEGGAAFAAHEASVASGRPVAVCVTTGPGIYNALTGLAAARADGGRVVLLSGATSPSMRGKGAVQETGPDTMLSGFQRPEGFIAHLSFPLALQSAAATPISIPKTKIFAARPSQQAIQEIISALRGKRFGVWAGYGALESAKELKELVERTGCGVIATPRAKGVFSEYDVRYVGVSGAGAHPSVAKYMKEFAPELLLVLGSRLGEVSSFWSPAMIPSQGFIQVDRDESAFGAGYPGVATMGVCADIRLFLEDLLTQLPKDFGQQKAHTHTLPKAAQLTPRQEITVRTPFLLQEVQRGIIEESDAIVMAESGNSFAWANHALRFSVPGRYRTSAAFGSMGHFVTGVVGAALVKGKAVVLAGDGAMLMNNELNTAVAYKAAAVWIVLNDARFGLTEHGMQALNLTPVETQIPMTDFVAFAKSQGAEGITVEREHELAHAIQLALQAKWPFVIDVRIDLRDFAPLLATRIASLEKQRGKQ
jgi:acetolactate synthase I/II/III large subunit